MAEGIMRAWESHLIDCGLRAWFVGSLVDLR